MTDTNTPTPGDPATPAAPAQTPTGTDNPPKVDETDWKAEARKWEQRAKDNKSAAEQLATLEESQKTESEKLAERLAEAKTEADQIPEKVASTLKSHLVQLHEITDEDAELFLTATDPDVLLKQVQRFVERSIKPKGSVVPTQGTADPSGTQVSSYELGRERAQARYQKQN